MRSLKLSEYIEYLKKAGQLSFCNVTSDELVTKLCFDSRKVDKGTLFVCKGAGFKKEYLAMAKEKGALAFVSEKDYGIENQIIVKDIRRSMAFLSNMFYQNPWEELKLFGLTGTKGKSTTLYYVINIMEHAKVCGKDKFGYLSTIDTFDGKEKFESHLTTPEAIELGGRLRNMADAKLYAAGMEVSSQALKYDRSYGLVFDIGLFTNFGLDHIGDTEHPSLEDYLESKLKFFDQCKTIILNLDTEELDKILPAAKNGKLKEKLITFSAKDKSADYFISDIRKENGLTVFNLSGIGELSLSMIGLFNVENAAAAAIVASLLGATNEEIKEGLLTAKAAGRMEVFKNDKRDLVVISDYAHNALSFEKLFSSVKEEFPGYRIEAVFGCPGGKGLSRREDLPKVAAKYADYIYVTEEDPADEDPLEISKLVLANIIKNGGKGEIEIDREKAITLAIKKAPQKTVVLLIAKGREEYMHRGDKYVPIKSDSSLAEELILLD